MNKSPDNPLIDEISSITMENLKEEVKNDLDFNITDADKISLRVPLLKDKYARYLYLAKGVMKNSEMKLQRMWRKKHIYYTENFSKRLKGGDLPTYISSDPDYQRLLQKLELDKLRVEYLDGILKSIDQISFNLSNAIKWHIFINGG